MKKRMYFSGISVIACLVIGGFLACQGGPSAGGGGNVFMDSTGSDVIGAMNRFAAPLATGATPTNFNFNQRYQAEKTGDNLLADPYFEGELMGIGQFVGGWRGNGQNADTKTNFSTAELTQPAPSPTCLFLAPAEIAPQILQRVLVEPDAYYYVSAWIMHRAAMPTVEFTLSLYPGPTTLMPEYNSRITTSRALRNGWNHVAVIVQIPPADTPIGSTPYLDIRFTGKSVNNPNTYYITNAEIYKLIDSSLTSVN